MPPIIISLDGNIGAGKSTLLEILRAACPDIAMVREPVDDWMKMVDADGHNILELFYKDTPRYSYVFQHTTLMTRIANSREAVAAHQGKDTVLISERSILTDRHVFAEMLRSQGSLTSLEWDLYKRWYELLTEHMPVSGVIYLTTSVPTCEERITRRGRPGECIPTSYLHDLHAAHQTWVDSTTVPVLRVSTEEGVPRDTQITQVREFVEALRARVASPVAPTLSTPLKATTAGVTRSTSTFGVSDVNENPSTCTDSPSSYKDDLSAELECSAAVVNTPFASPATRTTTTLDLDSRFACEMMPEIASA